MTIKNRFIVLTAVSSLSVMAIAAHGAELTVRIDGLPSDTGSARIVLMDSESSYKGKATVLAVASAPIENRVSIWKTKLPAGDYAVIAHHDANANSELDRPLFGLPLEPYGYSGGANTPFGLPDWSEVRFRVAEAPVTQNISVTMNPFAKWFLAFKTVWPFGLPF